MVLAVRTTGQGSPSTSRHRRAGHPQGRPEQEAGAVQPLGLPPLGLRTALEGPGRLFGVEALGHRGRRQDRGATDSGEGLGFTAAIFKSFPHAAKSILQQNSVFLVQIRREDPRRHEDPRDPRRHEDP